MDRYDEKRDRQDGDYDHVERMGDVLGLGGAAVPKAPGDPSAAQDSESMARRRERAAEDEERSANREDPFKRNRGAAGIDMGAGGRGTDLSGE